MASSVLLMLGGTVPIHKNLLFSSLHMQVRSVNLIDFIDLMMSGSTAYQFIHATLLEGALPALATVKRFAGDITPNVICESGFTYARFDGVLPWLKSLGMPPIVLAACDATSLLPRIRVRLSDDAVIGAAIPDSLLPTTDLRMGQSVNDLMQRLRPFGLATEIDVYMLSTPDPSKPSYYLAFFGQKKKSVTALTLRNRWQIIHDELQKRGVHLFCTAADGGGPNVSAQESWIEVR
jgi:hypothetical protein